MEALLRSLNWLLTADVFFVIAAFFWFAAALVGRSFDLNLGLDLWYQLWPGVFQPAIGLLMAGALVSGGIGWLRRRFGSNE